MKDRGYKAALAHLPRDGYTGQEGDQQCEVVFWGHDGDGGCMPCALPKGHDGPHLSDPEFWTVHCRLGQR